MACRNMKKTEQVIADIKRQRVGNISYWDYLGLHLQYGQCTSVMICS